jgi:hypothetical protein
VGCSWVKAKRNAAALLPPRGDQPATELGANFRVVSTRGDLVMDRDAATLPIFIVCITFTLIVALTYVWI